MVAHPGPDVLIPALASVYVVVAVPVPTPGRALYVKRVSAGTGRGPLLTALCVKYVRLSLVRNVRRDRGTRLTGCEPLHLVMALEVCRNAPGAISRPALLIRVPVWSLSCPTRG